MCGIAGFIDFTKNLNKQALVGMTDALSHRGPDGSGYLLDILDSSIIGLGHRRLSIIDLSEQGAQPMSKHNTHLIFNGEIYNYVEIQKELITLGYNFTSQSDTEVVLSAYDAWGPACVEKFIGMFAFTIYHPDQQKIVLFRDRLGVKPLFIYDYEGVLMFASELKSFHEVSLFNKDIDTDAVSLYFKYGFVPSPKCIFKHCYKLDPGCYLEVDLSNKKYNKKQYWSAKSFLTESTKNTSEDTIVLDMDVLIKSACNYRMVADVPVGVFLSGGYDSSLVTAMLQSDRTEKINTFTIGFENKKYNEANYADTVAKYLGTNHHSYICTTKEAQEIIPQIAEIYDEPFADSSAIPTLLVSKMTSQHVKVALSADGGDEVFSGYNRNLRFLQIKERLDKYPNLLKGLGILGINAIGSLNLLNEDLALKLDKASLLLKDNSLENIFKVYPQFYTDKRIHRFIDHDIINDPQDELLANVNHSDEFNKLLLMDYQSTLTNDMLVKVDRASMKNSLEGREPLLDHRIYEYMASIPSSLKMKDGSLKNILKQITHKYIPKDIMERPKMGFGIPVNDWLKTDLIFLVKEYLTEDKIANYGILNARSVMKSVNYMLADEKNNSAQLWLFLTFQMWCERWL